MKGGFFQHVIKINPESFRYAQKTIYGRDSHPFFHSGHHCATQTGTRGNLINGEFLPQSFITQQLTQTANNVFTFGVFPHPLSSR